MTQNVITPSVAIPLTDAEVKAAYESNADTNAFDDTEQSKLAGIATGAEVNVALADQSEAEAGTEATKTMTPLQTAQAITALGGSGGDGLTPALELLTGGVRTAIRVINMANGGTTVSYTYVHYNVPRVGASSASITIELFGENFSEYNGGDRLNIDVTHSGGSATIKDVNSVSDSLYEVTADIGTVNTQDCWKITVKRVDGETIKGYSKIVEVLTYRESVNLVEADGQTQIDFATIVHDGTLGQIDDTFTMVLQSTVASDVTLASIGGASFTSVQQMQDVYHSTGLISGGVITDAGSGLITLTAGEGYVRVADNTIAELVAMAWPASSPADVVLSDTSINYVYVDYNSGTPKIIAQATNSDNTNTNLLLGTVYREGTVLHITQTSAHEVGDHAVNMIKRLQATQPFALESGAKTSNPSLLTIAVTAGIFWEGLKQFTTPAVDTSAAGTFTTYYQDGSGGWTATAAQTSIDNLLYDDGDGGLATLANSRFGLHWVFLTVDGELEVLYGRGSYTLSEANDEAMPINLPPHWFHHARVVARIIVAKSDTVLTSVDSIFETAFTNISGEINTALADQSEAEAGVEATKTMTALQTAQAIEARSNSDRPNDQTGTAYTLALDDVSKTVWMANAASNVLTIPTNAAVAIPINTTIQVMMDDVGVTSITGDTGVTLNGISAGSGAISAQYKGVTLFKRGTDEWVVSGSIGAVT